MPSAAWTARAEAIELRPLRNALSAFLSRCGVGEETLQDVRLAVSEAISNAVRHAYTGIDLGAVAVDAAVSGDVIYVVVRDFGHGLRPRPDSPGAGLGLPIMARLTADLDVRELTGGGTEVRLLFTWRRGDAVPRSQAA